VKEITSLFNASSLVAYLILFIHKTFPLEIYKKPLFQQRVCFWVNPVRNSSGALNPAGIILKSNPAAAAGPEGAAEHYF
jgi:hypothetical protein